MGSFTNFPAALAGMLQQGFLEREFEEGLDSVLAYRRENLEETIPSRIGETLTRTRTGRLNPITTPLAPASNTGLDNGLTPTDSTLEQYLFTMQQYAATQNVDLLQDLAAVANNLTRQARNTGVQAAQSLERITQLKLFSAYMGGNSRVRTDLGAGSTTTCHVDDVRGFQTVIVNGQPVPVSGTNTLTVQETAVGAGGVTQALTVTGYTVDVSNQSSAPGGQSGTITFSAATTPVNGDALIAANAAAILRPFSHITTAQMTGQDVLTFGLVEDATARMRDNAVPPMEDGTYHIILDNTSMRQMWSDQDFKILFAGNSDKSDVWKKGDIVSILGMTFIPTTEAYVQPAAGVISTGTGVSQNTVRVRRPIVLGAEATIQGNFEGMETFLMREGVNAIGEVFIANDVAMIIRPPLDRLQQVISLSWSWVGDIAVPTDITSTSTIIPTSTNALYKRAVVI